MLFKAKRRLHCRRPLADQALDVPSFLNIQSLYRYVSQTVLVYLTRIKQQGKTCCGELKRWFFSPISLHCSLTM